MKRRRISDKKLMLRETIEIEGQKPVERQMHFASKPAVMKALRCRSPLPNDLLCKLHRDHIAKFKTIDGAVVTMELVYQP